MNKLNLNKIKFKKPEDPTLPFQDPIEIFCVQKFKGYYLRGQVVEISDNIYDKALPDGHGYAYYHFKFFALINDDYIKNLNAETEQLEYSRLGFLFGRRKTEFLKMQREKELNSAKEMATDLKTTPDKLLKDALSKKNKPIEINLKEIEIQGTPYILNSIRNKKEAIIVKLDLRLDRVLYPKDNKIIPGYPKRIYQLPAYHLAANSDYHEGDTAGFFENLFDILYFNFDYNFTDKREYHRLLSEIGELGYEWIENKSLSQKYIKKLNKFYTAIKDRSLPFYDFCYKFFDDLMDELKDKRKITQCSFCGNIFPFHSTKKYCALQTEGKNCGKSARNKRFYIRHKKEILPKARKTTRELRAFYREKGIKK